MFETSMTKNRRDGKYGGKVLSDSENLQAGIPRIDRLGSSCKISDTCCTTFSSITLLPLAHYDVSRLQSPSLLPYFVSRRATSVRVPNALQPVPAPRPCEILFGIVPNVFPMKLASVRGVRSVFLGRNCVHSC